MRSIATFVAGPAELPAIHFRFGAQPSSDRARASRRGQELRQLGEEPALGHGADDPGLFDAAAGYQEAGQAQGAVAADEGRLGHGYDTLLSDHPVASRAGRVPA